MSTHSEMYHRTGLPGLIAAWRSHPPRRPVIHPAVLVCVLLAAVAAVVIASSIADSGADRVAVEPSALHGRTPVTLPSGVKGAQRHGVIHAPGSYSPPGIWRGPAGPVLR